MVNVIEEPNGKYQDLITATASAEGSNQPFNAIQFDQQNNPNPMPMPMPNQFHLGRQRLPSIPTQSAPSQYNKDYVEEESLIHNSQMQQTIMAQSQSMKRGFQPGDRNKRHKGSHNIIYGNMPHNPVSSFLY
jgi:hypothetical protein